MRVFLRLKWSSHPVVPSSWLKGRTHKDTILVHQQEILFATTLFKQSSGRKKLSMKAESTTLDGQRETMWHEERDIYIEREREQTRTLNLLSSFLLQFKRTCSLISSPLWRFWYGTPFRSSPKNEDCKPGLSSNFRI